MKVVCGSKSLGFAICKVLSTIDRKNECKIVELLPYDPRKNAKMILESDPNSVLVVSTPGTFCEVSWADFHFEVILWLLNDAPASKIKWYMSHGDKMRFCKWLPFANHIGTIPLILNALLSPSGQIISDEGDLRIDMSERILLRKLVRDFEHVLKKVFISPEKSTYAEFADSGLYYLNRSLIPWNRLKSLYWTSVEQLLLNEVNTLIKQLQAFFMDRDYDNTHDVRQYLKDMQERIYHTEILRLLT